MVEISTIHQESMIKLMFDELFVCTLINVIMSLLKTWMKLLFGFFYIVFFGGVNFHWTDKNNEII